MDMDIKIFVACDKDSYVPDNPFLFPIQVGSALSKERYVNMLHDDIGSNISRKNRSYCELTALYWMWKNQDCDYYGLFHYRRYMCLDTSLKENDSLGNVVCDTLNESSLKQLGISTDKMKDYIVDHDAIVVRPRKILAVDSVYKEYGEPYTQHIEDLDVVIDIIHEKYPQFDESVNTYLHQRYAYDCNMLIMKKDIFQDYCSWLFSILEEAEDRINTINYGIQEYRVFGYLAERLCGIYFTYLKNKGDVRVGELPKVLFQNTNRLQVIEKKDSCIPVVIECDDELVYQLSVLVESLVKNTDRDLDIIVVHKDISNKNIDIIKRQCHCIQFVEGNIFDCLSLLKYEKVICLNTDVVVNDDISKLYDIDIGNHLIGGCKDIVSAGCVNRKQFHQKEYIQNELGIDDPYQYIQSDVLLVNVKKYQSKKIDTSIVYKNGLQDTWNVIGRNDVFYLSQKWSVMMDWEDVYSGKCRMEYMKMAPRDLYYDYLDARKNPSIIRYDSYQKPWECVDCDMSDYFWKYARSTPYYEVLKTMICSSIIHDKYICSLPEPVVLHKGKKQRAMECIVEHGLSYSLIHLIRRIYRRLTGKYKVVNGERIYD